MEQADEEKGEALQAKWQTKASVRVPFVVKPREA